MERPEELGCVPNEDCKYYKQGCRENTHHLLYPANQYSRGPARRLRAVLTTEICSSLHDDIHHTTRPPQHPSQERILDMLVNQDETYARFMENLLRQVEGLQL
jgi:hypothetical protein